MGCAFPMQNTEAPNVKYLKFLFSHFYKSKLLKVMVLIINDVKLPNTLILCSLPETNSLAVVMLPTFSACLCTNFQDHYMVPSLGWLIVLQ